MQVMVVESSRNKLGMRQANSTEFDPDTPDPVIDLMPDQKDVDQMGGTMRLGVYPCRVVEGSWAAKAYGQPEVLERHRHRFEFNNAYREALESVDLWPTGLSPDGRLVEIMEMAEHPFMVGVQFHPEFLSRPNQPHPLFREFIAVAKGKLREGGQHALPIATTEALKKGKTTPGIR
jgi:CTP synthase